MNQLDLKSNLKHETNGLDCRAAKEEIQVAIVKEKAKAKLKSGLGIARMTGSVMAGVDTEEKLERKAKYLISLCSLLLFSNIQRGHFCCLSFSFISIFIVREAEQREKFRRKREAMKARQKKKKVQRWQRL